MGVLIGFAFLAGVVTVLSPCILPVLPIILSGSTVGSKKYPLGVVTGFVVSFTVFTLFLTSLVSATGISVDFVRYLSIFIIFVFGLVLVIPKFQLVFEIFISKMQAKVSSRNEEASSAEKSGASRAGFFGGFFVGLSLGLVWTPCVGPILASVIALALSGTVSGSAVFVTFAYAFGTAIPMLVVMYGGRGLIAKVPWLTKNLSNIQRVFGVLLIIVAVAIAFNFDRQFQTYILRVFPQYGVGLTQIEESDAVRNAIDETFNAKSVNEDDMGKPMFDLGNVMYKTAPEFISDGEWLNSDPLTLEQLKGKVVLVDFWTYSCINCIRTLPYIETWYEKYKDSGLVIVGVHTPEFEFEKNADNVARAIKDFGLTYPVMQDNSFETWRAYENHYWPAKYFIDAKGRIRDMHFGEGEYDESEQTIRDLLVEAGYRLPDSEVNNEGYDIYSRTAETYLGYGRMSNFESFERVNRNVKFEYSAPEVPGRNSFSFTGEWLVGEEYAAASANAELEFDFESKEVFLVMSPQLEGQVGRVEVYLDGEIVEGGEAGDDVLEGVVTVDADRLYKLIKVVEPGRHLLNLKFLDDNVQVYAFTFG